MTPFLEAFLSQSAPQSSPGGLGGIGGLLPILLIFVVFYFILIRPQQKQAKRQQAFLAALKKGDEVVTQGGIVGTVFVVQDRTVTIDVGGGTKLRVVKAQVAGPWREGSEAEAGRTEAKK
jgi:preprotein translocase subunit YajC